MSERKTASNKKYFIAYVIINVHTGNKGYESTNAKEILKMKIERMEIRLSTSEKKLIREMATKYGLTASEYIRALVKQDSIKGGLM